MLLVLNKIRKGEGNMKQICVYLCVTMLVLLAVGKTNATPILDQTNPSPGSASGAEVRASLIQAQTFRVGISGQLTGVELYTGLSLDNPVEGLIIEIRTTESGLPTNNRLTSVTLPPEKVGRWSNDLTLVDLTQAELFVDPGDLLAIVLSSASTLPRYYNCGGTLGIFMVLAQDTSLAMAA